MATVSEIKRAAASVDMEAVIVGKSSVVLISWEREEHYGSMSLREASGFLKAVRKIVDPE